MVLKHLLRAVGDQLSERLEGRALWLLNGQVEQILPKDHLPRDEVPLGDQDPPSEIPFIDRYESGQLSRKWFARHCLYSFVIICSFVCVGLVGFIVRRNHVQFFYRFAVKFVSKFEWNC